MRPTASGMGEAVDQQEIADRLEIQQLMVRYVDAIDTKDWDLLDEVFTPDARLDYVSSGGPDAAGDYPTMKTWLQENLAIFPMTQHLLGLPAIVVDGDVATCRTSFHNPMGVPVDGSGVYATEGSGLHVFVVGGWYHDSCQRTAAGWRIVEKVEQQAFMQGGFPPLS